MGGARGEEAERWAAAIAAVRDAPSPARSPHLAELFALAGRTGMAALSSFRQLDEDERRALVQDKFATALDAIVTAIEPRRYFIAAVTRAAVSAVRRQQTRIGHAAELGRMAEVQAESADEATLAESLAMRACFATLSSRDQQVLVAVACGEDREEVAATFGTTRANIDQIVSRARKHWEAWE